MLKFIVGPPGGGKSYEAVRMTLQALQEGRLVVTNLPLNPDAFDRLVGAPKARWWALWAPRHLQVPDNWRELVVTRTQSVKQDRRAFGAADDYRFYPGGNEPLDWKHPVTGIGPLFVVDECHEAFPRVGPSDRTYQDLEEWFARHRHTGADVIAITQDLGKINNAIKNICQFRIQCKKAVLWGFSGRYWRVTFDGPDKAATVFHRQFLGYDKRITRLYQSYTVSGSGTAEAGEKVKPVYLRGPFKLMVLLVALSGYQWWQSGGLGAMLGTRQQSTPSAAASARPSASAHGPAAGAPASPAAPSQGPGAPGSIPPPRDLPLPAAVGEAERDPWELLAGSRDPDAWSIVTAREDGDGWRYTFEARSPSNVVSVSQSALTTLGVEVLAQGPCGVVLRARARALFVGCRRTNSDAYGSSSSTSDYRLTDSVPRVSP